MHLSCNSHQLQMRSPTVAVTLTAWGKIVQCALILCALECLWYTCVYAGVCVYMCVYYIPSCLCQHGPSLRVCFVMHSVLFTAWKHVHVQWQSHSWCINITVVGTYVPAGKGEGKRGRERQHERQKGGRREWVREREGGGELEVD